MKNKIVFESLNEIISFERKKDPLSALGIGQRKLIENWLEEMEVKDYIINDNFTISVNKIVTLEDKNLIRFPEYIQFNSIGGWFTCYNNQLISLRGCPIYVETWFSCAYNQLISLEGCPKETEDFHCEYNKKQFTKEDVKKLCNVRYPHRIFV